MISQWLLNEHVLASVQGCTISGQSEAGARVQQGANPTFTRTTVQHVTGVGLWFEGRAHGLFEDGEVSGCSGALVQIAGGAHPATYAYHLGLIDLSLGHRAEARAELARALATNPYFSPVDGPNARRALAALGDAR